MCIKLAHPNDIDSILTGRSRSIKTIRGLENKMRKNRKRLSTLDALLEEALYAKLSGPT